MMKYALIAALLLSTAAGAQQAPLDTPTLQALIQQIAAQRDDYANKAAVAAAQLKVANEEIARLKAPTPVGAAPAPSPTPTKAP